MMSLQSNLEQIKTLAAKVSREHGLTLVDTRLCQRGSKRCLEITIHRPGGHISFEDCETVSHQLSELLDQQSSPITQGTYLLEVQSPGINRELKNENEFHIFCGHMVKVQSREEIGGLGFLFQGELLNSSQECLIIGSARPITQDKHRDHPRTKSKNAQQETITQVEVELNKIISVHLYPTAEMKI